MTVSIPSAAGVPGISGPPIWFSGEPTFNPNLDDVRWRGAVKRTFGSGTGGSNYFRATQATVGPQKFIYLTFRAAFVQQLSDADDLIYLGLRKHNDASAMVVRITAHGAAFTPAGPPSANNPANVAAVDIWTLSGGIWTFQAMTPTWISQHARVWLQSSADVPADPNNRWGVQLRIPANAVGGITDNSGPNLGTDFDMWYLIHGSVGGNPAILADYRTAGTTNQNDLDNLAYPQPNQWDEFQLTSAAATSGGVAISWGDVVVQNAAHGEGTLIDNHANNTFIARPRNYSSANIPAGQINATFRIANWGSVSGNPNMPDFSSGSWDFVPGNSEVTPVISGLDINTIPAGTNPPSNAPIALTALMNLSVPPKSLHQCVLVTLSGANINFLNDAIYQNMNYDGASLFAREADISVVGLKAFSPTPRDVYLAVEKLNMAPTGKADEGQFLRASMDRLMRREGGALGDKLKRARSILSDVGGETKSDRLQTLVRVLSEVDLTEEELDQLFPTFRVHVYHDTGERVARPDGTERPVLKEQSSFGVYAYHEGTLEGWQTSIQGAQRIEDNLYLIPVPNDGSAKVKVVVQAVDEGEQRIPEDPIRPKEYPKAGGTGPADKKGCLYHLLRLFGLK
ncbi:MAG TPA: hypothetical protein VGQ41_23460 [Pyrinomonadaceae bacterium]|jgi:hypothetical protein|nr:hypothetical protein [Pyrinomonadaceae bacterium]